MEETKLFPEPSANPDVAKAVGEPAILDDGIKPESAQDAAVFVR